MTFLSLPAITAAVLAAAALLASLSIYIADWRRAPSPVSSPGGESEGLEALHEVFKNNLRKRRLILLGGIGVGSALIGYLAGIPSGLSFSAGSLLIMAAAVLAGAGGIEGHRYLVRLPGEEREAWEKPSVPSLALGLSLSSTAFLSLMLLISQWPDPLLLLYYTLGGLATALITRIGGSLMVLSCNFSFSHVNSIRDGLRGPAKPQLEGQELISIDHGGLAAEFMALYLAVMSLALGFGLLDGNFSWASVTALVQVTAAAGLTWGLALLIFLRFGTKEEPGGAWLNKGILAGGLVVLLTGLVAGYLLLGRAGLDMLWPLAASYGVLFIIAAVLQYNSSRRYKTVRNVARQSGFGPALAFLAGNSLGMGGMVIPLLVLALLALLADSAGSGKSAGTACILMTAGFVSSLAPLLTAYYFADEPREGIYPGAEPGPAEAGDRASSRPGSTSANLLGSVTFVSLGLAVLAGLGLLLRLGREGSLYSVSTFSILAFIAGVVLVIAVQALLYSSTRSMLAEIYETYRRPARELATGRQQWTSELYYLHCAETCRYHMLHPWLPLLVVIASLALIVFLLGSECIIPMMLAFAAGGMCFILWLEISGAAWLSASRIVNGGNSTEKGSDPCDLSASLATLGMVQRQVMVPALRLFLMLSLLAGLLLLTASAL